MGFFLVYNIFNANWVLSDSVDGGTGLQVAINAIGQAPLGFGIFLLWPLVRKFGKRNVMMIGFLISALGCLGIMLNSRPESFGIVLGLLLIRSLGAIPTYAMAAQLAESLDHIEWANGFRADGFSASVYAIIITVTAGKQGLDFAAEEAKYQAKLAEQKAKAEAKAAAKAARKKK